MIYASQETLEYIEKLIKLVAKLKFAYINKDADFPHDFETKAIKEAGEVIESNGGMEKLLKGGG